MTYGSESECATHYTTVPHCSATIYGTCAVLLFYYLWPPRHTIRRETIMFCFCFFISFFNISFQYLQGRWDRFTKTVRYVIWRASSFRNQRRPIFKFLSWGARLKSDKIGTIYNGGLSRSNNDEISKSRNRPFKTRKCASPADKTP